MVNPDQQRAAAEYLGEHYGVSQRRICRVMGRSRSILRYRQRRRADEPALNREIKRLARDIRVTDIGSSTPCWSGGGGRSTSNGCGGYGSTWG